jgi:hypothetical protein
MPFRVMEPFALERVVGRAGAVLLPELAFIMQGDWVVRVLQVCGMDAKTFFTGGSIARALCLSREREGRYWRD